MASSGGLELEVRISKAEDLEDASLGDGPLQAYVVICVPPNPEIRTGRNLSGHTGHIWNEIRRIYLVDLVESPDVHFHLYCYNGTAGDGPIIGSASFPLKKIIENAGSGNEYGLTRKLRHPSGRFQGTLTVTFVLRYSIGRNPSAPYTYNTTQPPLPTASQRTVVVGDHPPGIVGTEDASRMRDNGHHRHHQKLKVC